MWHRVAAYLLLPLIGCHTGQPGSSSPVKVASNSSKTLLSWSAGGFLWGTASLTIRRDGLTSYKFFNADPGQPGVQATLVLSSAQLTEITARLAEARPC